LSQTFGLGMIKRPGLGQGLGAMPDVWAGPTCCQLVLLVRQPSHAGQGHAHGSVRGPGYALPRLQLLLLLLLPLQGLLVRLALLLPPLQRLVLVVVLLLLLLLLLHVLLLMVDIVLAI